MTRRTRGSVASRRPVRPVERPHPHAVPDLPPRPALPALPWWAGPGLIAVAAAAMLRWTWLTWPDAFVDFGRELYVPWRIVQGEVLYRDVQYSNGPLSSHLNALWFLLFGTSLRTLALCNIGIAAALLAMLFHLLARVGTRLGATAAGVSFAALFLCAQLVGIGNYNFVSPYSHDLTHGVVLCVACLCCLARYADTGRLRWISSAGLVVGLILLTKVEIVVAAAAASGTGLALLIAAEQPAPQRLVRMAGLFLGAMLVPPAVATVLFLGAMSPADTAAHVLGFWRAAFRSELTSLPIYRMGLGTDDVPGNTVKLLLAALGWMAVLGPALIVALALRRPGRHRPIVAGVVAAVTAGAIAWYRGAIPWLEIWRPLPLFMAALAGLAVASFARNPRSADAPELALQAAVAVLGLGLLLKILLAAKVHHYGFALAMPATLVLVVALVDHLPARIDRAGGHGWTLRATVLAVLGVVLVAHLEIVHHHIAPKVHELGFGADAFRGDGRARLLQMALDDLRSHRHPGDTLAVFPEGIMLNYLARMPAPTPYIAYVPFVVHLVGEEPIREALARHPPDHVVLVHKNTAEEGARFFGQDYARSLHGWIMERYAPRRRIGAEPFRNQYFGIVLLEPKAGDPVP